MEEWLTTIEGWIDTLGPNPYIRSLAIVLASLVVGKIAEWIICRVAGIIARRTRTETDDQLIEILHRPVFLSSVFLGLGFAALELDRGLQGTAATGDTVPTLAMATRITLGSLKTIAILVWLTFFIRFSKIILKFLSRHQDRFAMVQPRTLPLFANLAVMVLIGAAVYLFLYPLIVRKISLRTNCYWAECSRTHSTYVNLQDPLFFRRLRFSKLFNRK